MTGDDERLALAALSRVCEPTEPAVTRLVAERGAVEAWRMVRSGDPALDDGLRARLLPRVPGCDPEADLAVAAEVGARLVCPGDPEWPAGLADLARTADGVPLALWVRGRHRLDEHVARAVAVVGARAATDYGGYVAGELAAGLADRGWGVVSGGAYGIDAAAHRGALAVGGRTVAVLACGVDVAYPRGHEALFARIAAEGLLVSELPPGATPHRGRFLVRNRVIAALSSGTVVVEAALRSGALSTARHAATVLRHVMAVPGPVTSALSAGCHRLVRDGTAVLVTGPDEVVEQVGALGADLAPEPAGEARPRDALHPVERQVLEAVPVARAAHPARIAVEAGVDVTAALRALRSLEHAGWVLRVGERWRLDPAAMLDLGAG